MKKRQKSLLLLAGLILFAVLGGLILSGVINLDQSRDVLGSSFTINLSVDSTSSGATRLSDYSLIFRNNEIIYGWYKHFVGPTTGNDRTSECTLDLISLSWIDKNVSQNCEINPDLIPLTKEGILQKINSEKFKPTDQCFHGDICYNLIR